MIWFDVLLCVAYIASAICAIVLLVLYLVIRDKDKRIMQYYEERFENGCIYFHNDRCMGSVPFYCKNYDKYPFQNPCKTCLKRRAEGVIISNYDMTKDKEGPSDE